MAPDPNSMKIFSFIRPHIPDSLTSGSRESESTPTPAPKRKKVEVPTSTPNIAQNPKYPTTKMDAFSQTGPQDDINNLFSGDPPPKAFKPATAVEEGEVITVDESSSDTEEMDFEDFDTEGMSKEELALWSQCAPKDQKLSIEIQDLPVEPSKHEEHFSEEGKTSSRKGKYRFMENFIRLHPFFLQLQTPGASFTVSELRAFEKACYNHARKTLQFSMRKTKKQIIFARQLCGIDSVDSGTEDDFMAVKKQGPAVAEVDRSSLMHKAFSGSRSPDHLKPLSVKSNSSSIDIDADTLKDNSTDERTQTTLSKKRKRQQPTADVVRASESIKKQKKKSKQADPGDTKSTTKLTSPVPRSDGVNGDPYQLPEVPEDVSQYLEAQAKKKRKKSEEQDHSKGAFSKASGHNGQHRDALSGEGLDPKFTNVASSPPKSPEVTDEVTKEDRAERKARRKERRRLERLSGKLSANDQGVGLQIMPNNEDARGRRDIESKKPAMSAAEDTAPPSMTSKGDTQGRKQKVLRAEPWQMDPSESAGEGVDHVLQPKKRKKKHKSKETSIAQGSGFQSPMIRDAEATKEGRTEKTLQKTATTVRTKKSVYQKQTTKPQDPPTTHSTTVYSNIDIDIEFPFSDSDLSSAPPSPILPPSPVLHSTSTLSTPPSTPPQSPSPSKSSKRKPLPPKTSPYFPTPPRTPRPLRSKGPPISCIPFPPLSTPRFGLVQESLAYDPFALLVAVIFLNKTRGKVALPLFYRLMQKWPTPEALAGAAHEEVVEIFSTLGLQNQRAKKVIALAKAWVANPPAKGKRWRRLNYPKKGDGNDIKLNEGAIGDEVDDSRVAWEVGALPGIGSYAIDSWRIFCRDQLRGLPNGLPTMDELVEETKDETGDEKGKIRIDELSKEWTRVLPLDKELRAYLRWRWLRLGWVWDPVTGERLPATEEMLREAEEGGVIVEEGGKIKVEGR